MYDLISKLADLLGLAAFLVILGVYIRDRKRQSVLTPGKALLASLPLVLKVLGVIALLAEMRPWINAPVADIFNPAAGIQLCIEYLVAGVFQAGLLLTLCFWKRESAG